MQLGQYPLMTNDCMDSNYGENCCRSLPIDRALVIVNSILPLMQVCPGQETGRG